MTRAQIRILQQDSARGIRLPQAAESRFVIENYSDLADLVRAQRESGCDAVVAPLDDFSGYEVMRTMPCLRIAIVQANEVERVISALGHSIDDAVFAPSTSEGLWAALARHMLIRSSAGSDGDALEARDIVGREGGLAHAFATLEKAASFDADVLIQGESGTGKELFARHLHHKSPRRHAPFVAINCAAIPGGLLESELFGHVRGAFTGAQADHIGVFQRASGGTLFLDEVGDFPIEMQAKILRALQSGEIAPLGSESTRQVDVRIVSATSRDLQAMLAEGSFREDLYYRLAVIPIELPPLRERPEDVVALIDYFMERFRAKHNIGEVALSADARQCLVGAPWPGNVRQLQNAVERLVVLCDGERIDSDLVRAEIRHQRADDRHDGAGISLGGRPLREAMREVEAELIAQALAACAGKRAKCAELLSISQRALLYKLKEHDLR